MDPITRARLNDGMRDVLAALLEREVQDPRVRNVTITGVEVTPDLAFAKVYFSILGDEEKRRVTQRGLAHVAGFLRREIGRRMRIRQTPELHFEFDDSMERGQRIETLLREIRTEPPAPPEDEA